MRTRGALVQLTTLRSFTCSAKRPAASLSSLPPLTSMERVPSLTHSLSEAGSDISSQFETPGGDNKSRCGTGLQRLPAAPACCVRPCPYGLAAHLHSHAALGYPCAVLVHRRQHQWEGGGDDIGDDEQSGDFTQGLYGVRGSARRCRKNQPGILPSPPPLTVPCALSLSAHRSSTRFPGLVPGAPGAWGSHNHLHATAHVGLHCFTAQCNRARRHIA